MGPLNAAVSDYWRSRAWPFSDWPIH